MNLAHTHTNLRLSLMLVLLCALSLLLPPAAPDKRNAPSRTESPTLTSPLSRTAPLTTERAREAYGQIGLSFEANRGQTEGSVNFLARGAGYTLFLKPTEAVFQLRNESSVASSDSSKSEIRNPQCFA